MKSFSKRKLVLIKIIIHILKSIRQQVQKISSLTQYLEKTLVGSLNEWVNDCFLDVNWLKCSRSFYRSYYSAVHYSYIVAIYLEGMGNLKKWKTGPSGREWPLAEWPLAYTKLYLRLHWIYWREQRYKTQFWIFYENTVEDLVHDNIHESVDLLKLHSFI